MTENQDPIACSSCGTVNPWMNEQCRDCGAELSRDYAEEGQSDNEVPGVESRTGEKAVAPETRKEEMGPTPHNGKGKRRLNFLWIIIGGLLFFMAISVCEGILERWVIPQEPELQTLFNEVAAVGDPSSITESDKERFRSVLLSNASFLRSATLVVILAPVLIGLLVGFFSGGIREGAVSLGAGTLILLFMAGQYDPIILVISSLLIGGLGTLGAFTGYKLARLLKRV